jgi:hypothetical protein
MPLRIVLTLSILLPSLSAVGADAPPPTKPEQSSPAGITHSFLVCGNLTAIIGEDSAVAYKAPYGTRDGFVLPSGNLLLAVNKSKDFPGGGIVEQTRDGKVVWSWKGTQSEVNSAQLVENGNVVTTEAGPNPRLLEIDRDGKTVVEFPLKCQSKNAHMETRMTRKLANGNYLAPHLLDFAVKEYTPKGEVVSEIKTPQPDPKEAWPFTAIRLENGNTLINCTHSNMVIEVDKAGKEVWRLTNADLPEPLLSDPCGGQRLANGNTVIASYGAGKADAVKMLEVTPDKKVVWTYKSGLGHGVHEFQILTTNGKPEPAAMK